MGCFLLLPIPYSNQLPGILAGGPFAGTTSCLLECTHVTSESKRELHLSYLLTLKNIFTEFIRVTLVNKII